MSLETAAHSPRIALLLLQDPLLLLLALWLGAVCSLVAWYSMDGLSVELAGCWKETVLSERAVFCSWQPKIRLWEGVNLAL